MTTDQSIDHLRRELNLTSQQADALFPALAATVVRGLEEDGICMLGALGAVNLGIWQERLKPDGQVWPEVACAVFVPSQTFRQKVQAIPLMLARAACRARGWDPDRGLGGRAAG